LQLCISDLLVRKFPEYREGQLSKLRSSLVGEKSLAKIAKKFRIGRFLLLGRGEDASGGRKKSSILENAVEAVIAAVYKDAGYEKTFSFIEEIFGPFIEEQAGGIAHRDYKSLLQELSQSRFKAIPKYRLVGQSGPDHDKTFLVNMSLKDIFSTEGTGKNKKEAEQEAARKAIEELESPEGGKP
jgi:ribonuclease III